MNQEHEQNSHPASSKWMLVFIGFALVAGFFLLTEHRAHVFGYLPYLLLLACPLMHLFGHGHGGHANHGGTSGDDKKNAGPTDNKGPESQQHHRH